MSRWRRSSSRDQSARQEPRWQEEVPANLFPPLPCIVPPRRIQRSPGTPEPHALRGRGCYHKCRRSTLAAPLSVLRRASRKCHPCTTGRRANRIFALVEAQASNCNVRQRCTHLGMRLERPPRCFAAGSPGERLLKTVQPRRLAPIEPPIRFPSGEVPVRCRLHAKILVCSDVNSPRANSRSHARMRESNRGNSGASIAANSARRHESRASAGQRRPQSLAQRCTTCRQALPRRRWAWSPKTQRPAQSTDVSILTTEDAAPT